MNSARFLAILPFPLLLACGGAARGGESASDVTCPAGQTFDGEYCQVDQNVATAEQPAPADEPAAQSGAPKPEESAPSEASAEETGAESEGSGSEEPVEPPTPPAERARATPVDVTMAAQAAPLIQYMAASHLPAGARQMGSPFAGQFAEGQILERKVQLTAGKCYTVMAAGLPPIAEVDLELYEEGSLKVAAQDSTSGLQAVLGSRDQCFSPAKTGTFQLVLIVSRGQGVAAAQVFQK